ncbi:MAG TPA: hypothetical protein VD996_15565, partial [Chitinophagaceae bacterium]|nr:hypothetical protein [Chitinophagaceae bacterium]
MHRPLLLFSALLITLALTAQVQVNRSSKPQVSERGISGRNLLSKEVVIPEIDLPQVLEKWKLQGHPKFAEPVRTDITPLRASQREENGKYVVYRMKITARKAHSITIYFDRLKLSQNAELYLYNPAGTIVTGPITYKENIAPGRTWGSNVFDGETVIVELKTPANEQSQNDLHIYQVLYGIHDSIEWADTDSAAFPGFGTAGNCNVNVICDASWANERNAVARVTASNGGMFSGALVMNTCGSARPFLLTAYHCIVNNDVVIDQSGSTFEFLWISPTCTPTTNTSSTLLFNGAVVRSKWSETDFALLELNQQIPSGSSLYFLGWDRSSTAPAASVGIHHPNGDIMKISKEHQTATVGNIGFYSNTAWRVV